MGTALAKLPTQSPHLHTLKMTFNAVPSVIPIINSLNFPSLRVVALNISDIKLGGGITLHPFLQSHPTLTDVTIDLTGKTLDPTALPHLESFSGHYKDPISVCDGKRPIKSLTLTLPSPTYNFTHKYTDKTGKRRCLEPLIFRRLSLASNTLKKLHLLVQPPDEDEDYDYDNLALPPKTIEKAAQACPNLTELELHVEDIVSWLPPLALESIFLIFS